MLPFNLDNADGSRCSAVRSPETKVYIPRRPYVLSGRTRASCRHGSKCGSLQQGQTKDPAAHCARLAIRDSNRPRFPDHSHRSRRVVSPSAASRTAADSSSRSFTTSLTKWLPPGRYRTPSPSSSRPIVSRNGVLRVTTHLPRTAPPSPQGRNGRLAMAQTEKCQHPRVGGRQFTSWANSRRICAGLPLVPHATIHMIGVAEDGLDCPPRRRCLGCSPGASGKIDDGSVASNQARARRIDPPAEPGQVCSSSVPWFMPSGDS